VSVLLMCLYTSTAAASFTTTTVIIIIIIIIIVVIVVVVGQDSAVGIATRYKLDSLGFESRWGLFFSHPSRLSLGPTQTPILGVMLLKRR